MQQTVQHQPAARTATIALLAVAAAGAGALLPVSATAHDGKDGDHGHTLLLALAEANQPWNAVALLALPLVLLAALVATEMGILFDGRGAPGAVRPVNVTASLLIAPLMIGLASHVAVATLGGGAPLVGAADLLGRGALVLTAIPATVITLTELRVIGRDRRAARRTHALAISAFLSLFAVAVVASVLG